MDGRSELTRVLSSGAEAGEGPVQDLIAELHARHRQAAGGKVASYIPELATADPGLFGVAVAMCNGFVYEAGDSRTPFTAQSISKPIVYGLALADHGRDRVLETIGVEPSGESFNSIVFDERRNRPFNPMVNAGAIAATSLVRGANVAERLHRILDTFTHFAGHPVGVDERVYRSEAATGHRNRAIAYLELNAGMIEGNADEHLDLYFQQCSILVTARDLAVIAATLANDGINPRTGARALAAGHVRDVLSVMSTCGMYDYAGEWQFSVGLPAKSGVSGGIMAVLPGQLGIGVFSPPLDDTGNSVRGLALCKELSSRLKLHLLDHRGRVRPAIRRTYRASEVRSKRVRRRSDVELLDRLGNQVIVYELQGDLTFANTEALTRRVLGDLADVTHVLLDGERITAVDPIACQLLEGLARDLAAQQVWFAVIVRHPAGSGETLYALAALGNSAGTNEIDVALELCEDRVLKAARSSGGPLPALALEEIDVLFDLEPAEVAALQRYLRRSSFDRYEHLIREGDDSDRLYFLLSGSVDIEVELGSIDGRSRVGTIDAGTTVGELALFAAGRRTADVVAASKVECFELHRYQLDAMAQAEPALWSKLLVAVGRTMADRLRRANEEIRVLSR